MLKAVLILIAILIISGFTYYYFNLPHYYHHKNTLKNVTELFSIFTPYMKSYVNTKLGYIDCEPKEYYYENNNTICFVCKDMDACFGFGEVIREKRKMLNPKGLSYLKINKFTPRAADFYIDGLATFFNCKRTEKDVLSCDNGILIRLKTDNLSETRYPLSIELTDKGKWDEIKNLICEKLRESTCVETNETNEMKIRLNLSETCACKDLKIVLVNNTIFYG